MSWVEVDCERDECGNSFKVDEELEERRCNKCGLEHYPPWDDPQTEDLAELSGFDDPEFDDGVDEAVSSATDGGAVHLHIHIHKQ